MTVANTPSRNQYIATSGQTVFPYTFEVIQAADIAVLKNGLTLSEGTDFTLTGVGNDNGGNVTLLVAASAGEFITIYRDMELSRANDYQDNGSFLASEVDADFDRLWLAMQQVYGASNRALRASDDDTVLTESNTVLADVATRANKTLGFNSNGELSYNSIAIPQGDVKYYSDVDLMKVDATLESGDFAVCARRYSGGDLVEGLIYEIQSSGSADGYIDHAIVNGIAKLIKGRTITARQFGLTSSSSGEAARLQAFLDYGSTTRDKLYLDGQYFYESDITIPSNVFLFGNGKTFTSSLIPVGDSSLVIGSAASTSSHSIEIRDITITCSLAGAGTTIIDWLKSYSVHLINLRFFNLSNSQVGVHFQGGGDCLMQGCVGRPTAGGGGINMVLVDSANTVDGVDHLLRLVDCDWEGAQNTVQVDSGGVDITGFYCERASRTNLSVQGGHAILRGGKVVNSGGSALPVIVEGGSISVVSPIYYDGDGNEPFVYYLNSGDFSKSSFYGVPKEQVYVNTFGSGLPHVSCPSTDALTNTRLSTVVDMAHSDTVTALSLTSLALETNPICIKYKLTAFVSSGGFGKALHSVEGIITKTSAGNYELSTPTTVNVSEDSSTGNSTVALSITQTAGTTLTMDVDLSLTGALNSGNTEQVHLLLELDGRTSNINVDFYGNRNQPVSL